MSAVTTLDLSRLRDNLRDNSPIQARRSPRFRSKASTLPLGRAGSNPALSANRTVSYARLRDNFCVRRVLIDSLDAVVQVSHFSDVM